MRASSKWSLALALSLAAACALSATALADPPNNVYQADMGGPMAPGQSLFDFSGSYPPGYRDSQFFLYQDYQGKLYGQGIANPGMGMSSVDIYLTGEVKGTGTSTTVNLAASFMGYVDSDYLTGTAKAKLQPDLFSGQLVGTVKGKGKLGDEKFSVDETASWPLPSGFNYGLWQMFLLLVTDPKNNIGGAAFLAAGLRPGAGLPLGVVSGKYDPKWDRSKIAFGPGLSNGTPASKTLASTENGPGGGEAKGCFLKLDKVQVSGENIAGTFTVKAWGQHRKGAFIGQAMENGYDNGYGMIPSD